MNTVCIFSDSLLIVRWAGGGRVEVTPDDVVGGGDAFVPSQIFERIVIEILPNMCECLRIVWLWTIRRKETISLIYLPHVLFQFNSPISSR